MRKRIRTVLVADLVGAARGMVAGVEVEDIGDGVEGGRWPLSLTPFILCLFPRGRVFLHSAGVFIR